MAVGRSGGRAVREGLLIAAALAGWAVPLDAQLSVRISAGVRYSSALVHDSIVTPFAVRPALAPALACTVVAPLQRGWAVQAMLDGSSSQLVRRDAGGSTTDLGRLSTATFTVGLRHRVRARFAATGAVGALKYFPSEDRGIFRLGSGPLAGVGMLALDYRPPLGANVGLAVEARYDVHAFTTPALEQEGFASPQLVHRVSLSLRAGAGRL
jgi:hypothetical protein